VGDRGNDRRLISLPELGRAVRLEVVPLWIGLLHGSEEWQLQQTGEFYDQTRILVTVRGKKGIASDIQRTLTI